MWYSFLYIPGTMFLDLSQKKFVYLKHYKYFVFFAQLPWRTQLPSHREFLHLFVLFASKINVESMKKNLFAPSTCHYFKREQVACTYILTRLCRNGILLPKLFWPTARKNVLVIEKNFWNSRLKAENSQNFWDH